MIGNQGEFSGSYSYHKQKPAHTPHKVGNSNTLYRGVRGSHPRAHTFSPFIFRLGVLSPLLLLVFISLTSAVTFDEVLDLCLTNNYTLEECYNFFGIINNYCSNSTTTTYLYNCTNETVVVEKNCTQELNFQQAEWTYNLEMAKISSGQEDSITNAECDVKISEAIINTRPSSVSSNSDSNTISGIPMSYLLIAAIGVVGFFIYSRRNSSKTIPDYSYRPPYDSVSSLVDVPTLPPPPPTPNYEKKEQQKTSEGIL